MISVPGKPKTVEKIPANSTRIKMVNPAISRGDNLPFPPYLRRFDVFPGQDDGARDKYGGVRASHQTHQEGEGKVVDNHPAKEEQDSHDNKDCKRCQDRPAQRLIDTCIDGISQALFDVFPHVFPDPIEDNDGVIYRISDNG